MEQRNIYSALQFSVTSFMLGAFLFMTFAAVGLPVLFSRGNFEVIKHLNWLVFFLELFLMTAGFFLITVNLIHRIALKQWRGFLAGIISVLLLGIISVFSQGAGLSLIIMLSIVAGMFSALSLLIRNSGPML